jgi:hypothetical protein
MHKAVRKLWPRLTGWRFITGDEPEPPTVRWPWWPWSLGGCRISNPQRSSRGHRGWAIDRPGGVEKAQAGQIGEGWHVDRVFGRQSVLLTGEEGRHKEELAVV